MTWSARSRWWAWSCRSWGVLKAHEPGAYDTRETTRSLRFTRVYIPLGGVTKVALLCANKDRIRQ